MKYDTKQAVSTNLQEKGQVYIAGRDWQTHLFPQCLCFKCHPPTDLVLKHTVECDEMSVLLSPDQIRWMKVKQEQKYYFCHFFYALQELGQLGRSLLNKCQPPCNVTHWSAGHRQWSLSHRKGHKTGRAKTRAAPYNTVSCFKSESSRPPSVPTSDHAEWEYGFLPTWSKHGYNTRQNIFCKEKLKLLIAQLPKLKHVNQVKQRPRDLSDPIWGPWGYGMRSR